MDNPERVALEILHQGCLERGLEVKGDGDWMQMARTILLIVDNSQSFQRQLVELLGRVMPCGHTKEFEVRYCQLCQRASDHDHPKGRQY